MGHSDFLLFPHCYIAEDALAKVLETHKRLRICLPWYMSPPEILSKLQGANRVTILYPPETLKPNKDFLPLLSEYRSWIKENKGKAPHLSASELQDNEASWKIRKTIRTKAISNDETQKDEIIRWHLILHLAGELEKENADVEASLKKLKNAGSPLREAIGEEDLPEGILDDLPSLSPASSGKITQRLNHWIEAWFGLFASHVEPGSDLLTMNRDIFQFVLDLFEKTVSNTPNGFESSNLPSVDLRPGGAVKLPELSVFPNLKRKRILFDLAGKSLHLLENL